MSISPLGSLPSSSALHQMEALFQKLEANASTSTTPTTSSTSTSSTDSDSISGIGKLLSNLQDLATTDPAKFKQETADIATQLNSAASNTTGDESTFLKGLASQFQQASDTGDASALTPKHHGHHHASGGTTSSSNQSNAYDSTNLFSLLNSSSSTTASSYAASSQQSLLTSLFGSDSNS